MEAQGTLTVAHLDAAAGAGASGDRNEAVAVVAEGKKGAGGATQSHSEEQPAGLPTPTSNVQDGGIIGGDDEPVAVVTWAQEGVAEKGAVNEKVGSLGGDGEHCCSRCCCWG